MSRLFTTISLSLLIAGTAFGDSLADVLTRLDQTAQQFRSFTADVKRTDFTAVLNESSEMEGQVRLRKEKGGVAGVTEFSKPEAHTIYLNGRNVENYYPKANTVQIYDTGKAGAALEQFTLLGFGTTGAELKKNYDMKLGGPEKIGAISTTRIELYPKSGEAKNQVTKIELWVPDGQGYPVQEKVTQTSKNYLLFNYSNLKMNPALPDAAYTLALPAGVKKVYPQK